MLFQDECLEDLIDVDIYAQGSSGVQSTGASESLEGISVALTDPLEAIDSKGPMLYCGICDQPFTNKEQFLQHAKSYHMQELSSSSNTSKSSLRTLQELAKNSEQKQAQVLSVDPLGTRKPLSFDSGTLFMCFSCGNQYSSEEGFQSHLLTCPQAKMKRQTWPCDYCDAEFSSRKSMHDHKRGMHECRLFQCRCGQTFKWRTSYRRHQLKCSTTQ